MAPLIALGISFLPDLARLIFGEHAGRITESVAEVVRTVTGTDDPAAAKALLDKDPALVSQLRIELAKIAAEGEKARLEAEQQKRQAELDALRAQLQDTEAARTAMTDLQKGGSSLAWAPAVVSIIVTVGFFGLLIWLTEAFMNQRVGANGQVIQLDANAASILNIAIGALVAGFTAVVNFWIGSSQGSKDKDNTVRALQVTQAQQASSALSTQAQQATAALNNQTASTQAVIAGLRPRPEPAPPPARVPAAAAVTGPPRRSNFSTAVELVLDKEGNFSNHPRDKGGPTKFGITFRTYASFHDMQPDDVTVETMQALTREEAIEIYRTEFWLKANCDRLPAGVDLAVFDFGVNSGMRTAVRKLQQGVGVKDDGSIGDITIAAVGACGIESAIRRLCDRRLEFVRALDDFAVFGNGWTTRINAIRDAALRMAADAAKGVAA